jgi:hypothetical protein
LIHKKRERKKETACRALEASQFERTTKPKTALTTVGVEYCGEQFAILVRVDENDALTI